MKTNRSEKKKNMMRIAIAIIAIIAGGFFGRSVTHTVAEHDADREKLIIQATFSLIEARHFEEKPIDDAFSLLAFDNYLTRLDGGKRFLTKADLQVLSYYKDKIDDAILEPDVTFFELSSEIIRTAVDKVSAFYPSILDKPFDFTIDEEIELDGDKFEFAADDSELMQRWHTWLKYETLTRLSEKLDAQEKEEAPDGDGERRDFTALEEEARDDVRKTMDDWFKRLSEARRSDRFELYLNAITNVYDPHTDYFNPKEKEDFNINMSRRLEGIGARLSRVGDYSKVVTVVPGGPAWRQGDLQADDVIHTVTQEGEEPVDIQGMHLDEVVSMIRGKKGTYVTLHVRSKDGEVKVVRIQRDEVHLDDGLVRSAVIEFPGKVDKVGFIDIPKFYADFENPDGRSSAQDVAREIEKLRKQNVQGIIIDLRNNSGGSLNDVVEISGLFIKEGPIVQVQGRSGPPHVYRDKDPEVRYTGPLVILVNAYSASASEILAAALQDYGRAMVVGSRSTFGKGTVQRFYNLDRGLRGNTRPAAPLGELKLTVQKFYRINGGSTQLKGVIPDIILPDRFAYIETGEKEIDHAMPWTEIDAVSFRQEISDLSQKERIRRLSQARVAQHEIFNKVDENARRIRRVRDQSVFPLHLGRYRDQLQTQQEEADQYRDIFVEIDGLKVYNLTEDLDHINIDSSRIGRNEAWIKGLGRDSYVEETLFIMQDMIAAGVVMAEPKGRKP